MINNSYLRKDFDIMKKKILCLALALAFSISGCNSKTDETVVATVGETPITMSQFNFYLTSVKQQMQGTELSTEEDWQTKEIDGKKAIEVAKEQALNIAATNVAYIDIYKNSGYEIGSEEKAEIKATKNSIVEQYEANGGYDAFLKQAGITDDFVDLLCESMYCSDVLYAEFGAQREVTDEEINTFFEENAEIFSSYRTAKHVLILTKDMETNEAYDDAKKADAKKKADEIHQRALSDEDFDALVSQYSEDPGSQSNPEGYTFTDGEMVEEFQNCVDSLSPGQIGFVESSFGYHIIKREELNKDYFIDNIKKSILTEAFNEYIEGKMEEYSLVVTQTDAINEAITTSANTDTDETNASGDIQEETAE